MFGKIKEIGSNLFGNEQPAEMPAATVKTPAAQATEKKVDSRITIGERATWAAVNGKPVEAHAYRMKREWENRHFLIAGTTGAGKSTLLYQMFDQIRARGTDKALIIDHGGENISRYYREGDVILNPFDARFPGWHPFNEIRNEMDADNLGRFIVADGIGESASWNGYAQNIAAGVLRQMKIKYPRATILELARMMAIADADKVKDVLGEFEPGVALFQKGSEKMAANARSILGDAIDSWRYIPTGTFSVRKWIENDNDSRWVFLSYKESNFRSLRGFMSTMVSIAVNYALDLPTNENRRVWFQLDEMGSLPKMAVVADALTKIRKKGGCVVAGLQSLSQLQDVYGEKGATTLLANFNTYISMRSGDADTAELFSRHFGEQEIWRQDFSDNAGQGGGGANTGEAVSTKLHVQRVQTYTENMLQADLTAMVKFPGALPCAPLKVPCIQRPKAAEAFIPVV